MPTSHIATDSLNPVHSSEGPIGIIEEKEVELAKNAFIGVRKCKERYGNAKLLSSCALDDPQA